MECRHRDVMDPVLLRHQINEVCQRLQPFRRQLAELVPCQHQLGQGRQIVERSVHCCYQVVCQVQNAHFGDVVKHVGSERSDEVRSQVDAGQVGHVAERSVGDVRDAVEPKHDLLHVGQVLKLDADGFNVVGLKVDGGRVEGKVLRDLCEFLSVAVDCVWCAGTGGGAGLRGNGGDVQEHS